LKSYNLYVTGKRVHPEDLAQHGDQDILEAYALLLKIASSDPPVSFDT
jgi:hypothetical protein